MDITTYLERAGLSRDEFARRIGVSAEAVRLWESGLRRPSPRRAIDIERATDGGVSRAALRPDIFGTEAA